MLCPRLKISYWKITPLTKKCSPARFIHLHGSYLSPTLNTFRINRLSNLKDMIPFMTVVVIYAAL